MSQENVELVRRLYSLTPDAAGIVRGDYDDVFFDYFHPDVEVVPPLTAIPIPSPRIGAEEGVRRWFRQIDEIWDDWRFEAERFIDAGSRVVALVARVRQRQAERCSGRDLGRTRSDAAGRPGHAP